MEHLSRYHREQNQGIPDAPLEVRPGGDITGNTTPPGAKISVTRHNVLDMLVRSCHSWI